MQRYFTTSFESSQFIQTTVCTPREICPILWAKYSQFFTFHLCTNDSYHILKSGNVLFWVLQLFCSSKNFHYSSLSRLTDCSLSMLQRWRYFLPFTFPFYSTSIIRENIFTEKKIERLLGSIRYISHSVSMPFKNRLIIGCRVTITRLSVTFTLMPVALV